MVKNLVEKGKRLLTSQQNSVLSAASLIMIMIIASRVLGLIRQRILAHFFTANQLSLFFAAFRLPDLVFEVLVFGTFSSAFIPVFTRSIKEDENKAWETASYIVNIGVISFLMIALILGLGADTLYSLITPGFPKGDTDLIASLARILFTAQGFFVFSYVLTGVLESLRRFLIPALAPLFYNIGIILGTVMFSSKLGIYAPAFGVVIGAFAHFMIQFPFAIKMGFKLKKEIKITSEVRKIGKLALPRMIEVSFLQLSKTAELFFSSLISKAAYTYYTFGNTLQLLPVGLFGTSIAKAALPTLSSETEDLKVFRRVLYSALYDMSFFVIPLSTIMIVLRVPIVRLVFGTDLFSWEATIQTGYVLTAFSFGIFFQSVSALFARSFYALHDTKTPVVVSIASILTIVVLDYVFIRAFHFQVWGLAAAFSIGSGLQATSLFLLMNKKIENGSHFRALLPILKTIYASIGSGLLMFFILKFFDRSVWVKRLSFLGRLDQTQNLPFERFVLDTRYTINLIVLTFIVVAVGFAAYISISIMLNSEQVWHFIGLVRKIFVKRKITPLPLKEEEPLSPPTGDMV